MDSASNSQTASVQLPSLSFETKKVKNRSLVSHQALTDEYIWQNFMTSHRIIHLLRPDYFMIYKFSRSTILFQRNISLDLGEGDVTSEKIMRSMLPSDQQHFRDLDKAMIHIANERKLQPMDYIFRVCGNIECPNPALKRVMRTSFLIHCSNTGMPELGFICFHDVTSMVAFIRPDTYDITFDPAHAHLVGELKSKLLALKPHESNITARERDIVLCLHKGMSSKEIAAHLFISKATVDTHRQNMLRKWELPNTTLLVKKAIASGWV